MGGHAVKRTVLHGLISSDGTLQCGDMDDPVPHFAAAPTEVQDIGWLFGLDLRTRI